VAAGRTLDVDFALLAFKAQSKPFLPLTAISRAPGAMQDFRRDFVSQPFGCLGDERHARDAGLFVKFAQCCLIRLLAGIDPALRHLPFVARGDMLSLAFVAASTDKDEALFVEEHHADADAVR
jgi:hypothetical protein